MGEGKNATGKNQNLRPYGSQQFETALGVEENTRNESRPRVFRYVTGLKKSGWYQDGKR